MNNSIKKISFLFLMSGFAHVSAAQPVPLAEVILISNSAIKSDVKPDAIKSFFAKATPAWNDKVPGTNIKLFQADRGKRKGEFLLTLSSNKKSVLNSALPEGSPFTDKVFSSKVQITPGPSQFLVNPDAYTEYELVGENAGPLPVVELLGIHYIKVKKDNSIAFEKFVREKLNPRLTRVLPEMGLFYYKAVAGENQGSYITIFAISSVEGREKYWPTGKPEMQIVKDAFKPLNELARELGTYLEADSYLKPESGGGAAYFESLEWTDYVVVK